MKDLFDAVVTDYKNNERRSLATLEARLVPLRAAFDLDRAIDVDESRIEKYKAERLASKRRGGKAVAAASVNRELAALRRAFRLAVKQMRLGRAPNIEMLAEAPPREGFVEPNQFEALLPHLPAHLQDFARFGYTVSWRKGALRRLRWLDVDRESRRVYLRQAGIGPEVGMKITGHETDSMWRRYSVVQEDDIEEALQLAQQYITKRASEKKEAKVVAMSEIGK